MRVGAALSYLFGDHLGSTSLTADANGSLSGELRYLPFGETRYENGQTPTSFRYTGQREAAESGLYFYGARWYDSYLNRWIQPDSIIPDPTNSQNWDRYAYVRNNPVRFNDPSGHVEWCSANAPDGTCEIETKQALFHQRLNDINAKYKTKDDLKAMVLTVRAAATYFREDIDLMMLTLNEVFLGTPTLGPDSMWNAHKFGHDTGYGYKGFHDEYLDKSNQVRHFWAALASSTIEESVIEASPATFVYTTLFAGLTTEGSALVHELYPPSQGSYADFVLSTIGNGIGMSLSMDLIEPLELGSVIESAVGPYASITPSNLIPMINFQLGY